MRLRSKEKAVRDLIHEHLSKVKKCAELTTKAIDAYVQDNAAEAQALEEEVNAVETQADDLRRKIARKLMEGAFLPMMREPLLEFVKRVDRIADAAERVCEMIFLTQMEIPDDFKRDFVAIAENAQESITLLRKAFDAMFKKLADVLPLVHECTGIEHRADQGLEDMIKRIFASDLELAHKTQLYDLAEEIDNIVDAAEDAADVLEMITVITSV